jgi:amidase
MKPVRAFLSVFLLTLVVTAMVLPLAAQQDRDPRAFQLVEATIADIEQAFQSGLLEPAQLVRMYLARIAAYDQAGPTLNSYMVVNPHAVADARALDGEHRRNRDNGGGRDGRQPLWGVPIVVKDNNDTADMATTAGSVALAGSVPPDDAFVVARLRAAGAIILGKATLTEYANFLTAGMPAGFSSQLRQQLGSGPLVGYGFNPYDPRKDPRPDSAAPPAGAIFNDGRPALSPGGSSSGPGIAVAANLAAVGIGTETSGSILSPGTQNLLVGIKPTVGLVSRDGIIPITADQDTAGPLARTVEDAAKVLGVIAGFDPHDPATRACLTPGNCLRDYTKFLKKNALKGARIAVPHFSYWTNAAGTPNFTSTQLAVMNDAIAVLREEGAFVADPYEIPDQAELNAFGGCGGLPIPANCSTVLLYGFKRDLNAYLASLGPSAPVRTLADVIAFNNAHSAVALKYGQVLAVAAQSLDISEGSADTARYRADRAKDLDLAKTRGLDVVYAGPDLKPGTADDFDAILFPANRGANIAARAGYPSIVVPGGFVTNQPELNVPPGPPFPGGFDPKMAPYGVTFSGPAFSEARLIGLAYAYEQATKHRTPPESTPALRSDTVRRK